MNEYYLIACAIAFIALVFWAGGSMERTNDPYSFKPKNKNK